MSRLIVAMVPAEFYKERCMGLCSQLHSSVGPRLARQVGLGMLTYEAARDTLVGELRADAAAHRAENYDAIGRRFDRLEYEFPRGTAPALAKLRLSLSSATFSRKPESVSSSSSMIRRMAAGWSASARS